MKGPRNHKTAPSSPPAEAQKAGRIRVTATSVGGWKAWGFRLTSLVLAPVLCFGLLELGLRIAGIGYRTAFLLPVQVEGQKLLVQNNQFGWRFFGAQMARTPQPLCLPQIKAAETVRVFVFGESAAYGDPQPQFGLPRMLQALLCLRYPGAHFEVVNAAMTGINSHVILPIARDCARAQGDIWVLYIGNNEVIGPFGAGTVFGPRTPALLAIRTRIALLATRSGQWLSRLFDPMRTAPSDQNEWGGMKMFLDHPVTADDPNLPTVYQHFEQNLGDIIRMGKQSGAGIVVSTVAVNLRDCAPFASAHRPSFPAAEKTKWEQLYQRGVAAQKDGQCQTAAACFLEAAGIDDRVAELRFRLGECALECGQPSEAQRHFQAARELDALRFRCDNPLNQITRRLGAGQQQSRVCLADAERAFAEQCTNGVPGQAFFYDHVHLTFEGNYLLARTIASQIEPLLAGRIKGTNSASPGWASLQECAARLGWTDWSRRSAYADIFRRRTDPPFTVQINQEAQMRRLNEVMQELAPACWPGGVIEAQKACEAAVAAAPEDPVLHAQLAALRQETGDLSGAESDARRVVALLPGSADGWSQLGLILAKERQFAAAADDFRRAFAWDSNDVWSLQNLAQALAKLGQHDQAILEYRRALAIKPRFGLAWLGQGQILESLGRKAEAEHCYHQALANRIRRPQELILLARFCQARGWLEAAVTNYAEAVTLSPVDAMLRLETGQSLAAGGRHADAEKQYAEAVRLAPGLAEARFLDGLALGRLGVPGRAVDQFREAIRLRPNWLEARLNLGVALMHQARPGEALAQFEEVLRQSPANALALRYAQNLRAELPSGHL